MPTSLPSVVSHAQEMCQKETGKTSVGAEADVDLSGDGEVPITRLPKKSLSKRTSSSDDEEEEACSKRSSDELSS